MRHPGRMACAATMRPFTDADFPQAAALLHEGFPHHSLHFWQGALQRLQRYSGNREARVPPGYFMLDKGQPVGLALALASLRKRADGSLARRVNLSCWYVRPEFRFRAGFMLRGIVADKGAIYTDLTATPEVQRMLPALGFKPTNRGVAIRALPLLCGQSGRGARLESLPSDPAWPGFGPPRAMLEAHRELGCVPLVLSTPQGRQLLVFKPLRLRGQRAVQLVYAQSRTRMLSHMGVVARHWLAAGVPFLVHDTPQAASSLRSWFRPRDLWFSTGEPEAESDCTDAFASELTIIHAPGTAS